LNELVCQIFGKKYEVPEERHPSFANWYRTIDDQVEILLKAWDVETAAQQVSAYIEHCQENNRKMIATNHKVAETILQSDWLAMKGGIRMIPIRADPFKDARDNLKDWTKEAWEKHYEFQLKTDNAFRKAFGYAELRSSGPMGSNTKGRQSA
jgi:hypothetical protein